MSSSALVYRTTSHSGFRLNRTGHRCNTPYRDRVQLAFELGFALARLSRYCRGTMMVGEQQPGADAEIRRAVPGRLRSLGTLIRQTAAAARLPRSRKLIDMRLLSPMMRSIAVRIALRRLDEILANGKPLVGLRPGASLAPSRGRDVVRLRPSRPFLSLRESASGLSCYNVLSRLHLLVVCASIARSLELLDEYLVSFCNSWVRENCHN